MATAQIRQGCLVGALAGFALAACGENVVEENAFPQPDGHLAAIERFESGGGAAGWVISEVLVADANGERVSLGAGTSSNGVELIGWNEDGSLSVCYVDEADILPSLTLPDGQVVIVRQDCSARTGGMTP